MSTAAIVAGTAAAGLGGAALSANAAGNAADAQVSAANYAAQLQSDAAKNALDFQKQQYYNSQSELAPWLSVGTSGLANLGYALGLMNPTTNATPISIPGTTSGTTGVPAGGNGSGYTPATSTSDGIHPVSAPTAAGGTSAQGNQAAVGEGMPVQYPSATNNGTTLGQLVNPSLGAAGSLLTPWTEKFSAPTDVTQANDPGYQFRLQQGLDALKNSATATGTIFSGATAKGLEDYAQNYASNEYGNVYNRALNDYLTRYNIFQNNQANTFNRLAAISGVGQTTAQNLATLGQNTANSVSNTLTNSAAQIGQQANNAGAARASGYASQGNIWGSALSNTGSGIMNMLLAKQFLGGTGGGGSIPIGGYQVPDTYYGY